MVVSDFAPETEGGQIPTQTDSPSPPPSGRPAGDQKLVLGGAGFALPVTLAAAIRQMFGIFW